MPDRTFDALPDPALAEVGILYASPQVHQGWSSVGKDGVIKPSHQLLGGHALAIVAYD